MQCMRDLFTLWRAGKLMSAEALGHAQYVVGGYLVLTSGHANGPLMAGRDLAGEIAGDPNLSATIAEFIKKERPTEFQSLPAMGAGADNTELAGYLAMFLKILLDLIVDFMKKRM